MATTVKITETYDMKTSVGKMGIVGIHTPSVSLLRKLYPGLLKNHRFLRFVKCDVVGACASVLPADPLQVGVSAGEVAPEDMFNPILYTAVTNESFDTLLARINALSPVGSLASVDAGNMFAGSVSADNNFATYYALLSENGKWRKAMPQSGFRITGLVPLAHTIISPFGNFGPQGNIDAEVTIEEQDVPVQLPDMTVPTLNAALQDGTKNTIFYRGKSVRMPKFPIHSNVEEASVIPFPNIPQTNILAMILPPAKLHEFYYRMRISWTVRFENVVSTNETARLVEFVDNGGSSHYTNYTFSSSKETLDNSAEMIDSNDVEITKIMES